MSLSVHSPFLGQKRLLSDREDSPEHSTTSSPKRLRRLTASPTGRCSRNQPAASREPSTLTNLRSLFPSMDEKVVVQVLDSCGNNIDEAIKLLGALQLSRANGSATDVSQGGVSKSGDQKDAAHLLLQQQPNASHMPTAGLGRDAGTEAEAKERRKGPAEWVEGLVQQMGSARDMGDARIRAAQELRAFEQAVAHTTNKARQAEVAGLQARIVELSKENALLKRAVTIQQSRLQEAEANSKHQASQAQSVISDLQGKVHSLEVSNYSLSLHLRQATATQSHKGSHPDVF